MLNQFLSQLGQKLAEELPKELLKESARAGAEWALAPALVIHELVVTNELQPDGAPVRKRLWFPDRTIREIHAVALLDAPKGAKIHWQFFLDGEHIEPLDGFMEMTQNCRRKWFNFTLNRTQSKFPAGHYLIAITANTQKKTVEFNVG